VAKTLPTLIPGCPSASYCRKGNLVDEGSRVEPNIVYFSDIPAERVNWLWKGRIPREMLTLLVGLEGDGKSMYAAYIMAQVSTGRPWADERDVGREPGSVLYLTTEDDPNKVTSPRLLSAEADMSKIAMISGFKDGERVKSLTNLTDQMAVLMNAAAQMPDLKLIVIDPISAYMEGKNENRNSEVREYLNPLVQLAKGRKLAVIGITHLNKNEEASSLSRVLGSRAFTATPRAVWLVRKDPYKKDQSDPDRFLVVKHKWNLGKCAPGLAYSINDVPITMDDETQEMHGHCLFEAEPVYLTAEDLLRPSAGSGKPSGRPRKRETASDWLWEFVEDGEKPAAEVYRAGKEAGFGKDTLRRAAKQMNIQIIQKADPANRTGGIWMWSLPQDDL
jgi:putative DNA primase/helicase